MPTDYPTATKRPELVEVIDEFRSINGRVSDIVSSIEGSVHKLTGLSDPIPPSPNKEGYDMEKEPSLIDQLRKNIAILRTTEDKLTGISHKLRESCGSF